MTNPEPPVAPDDTPPQPDEELVPHPFNFRADIWCKDCEYHRDNAIHTPVAPDDTPTRLMDKIESYPFASEGGDLRLCVHWQELRAAVSRLREALQEAKEDGDESAIFLSQANDALFKAEADVSRLQQENALLRRSLEMLTKQLDEKDERIDELTGLIGEVD